MVVVAALRVVAGPYWLDVLFYCLLGSLGGWWVCGSALRGWFCLCVGTWLDYARSILFI